MGELTIDLEDEVIGAIDIGGTKVAVGLVTRAGSVLCRRSLATAELPHHSIGIAAIEASLRECLDESGRTMTGIGIGCTGPVNPLTGIVGKVANLPGWEGCRLVDEIAGRFGLPAAVENDADAAALAEATWGSGAGIERFLYVTISTGIGAGLLLNGKVYRGANGAHPEMGHHTIDPSGPTCYCGTRGCWESLASGTAIANWFLENDRDRRFSPESFSARTLFDLHRDGDPLAERAVERLSYYLGLGLANLTTILVPDVIAIGGGIARASSAFLDQAIATARRVCGEVPAEQTEIRLAQLQSDLDLAGAAAVWLQSKSPAD